MDNGDATQGHAMTPEEFAKLMGAYPQPAENPLPAYGGYMDNSPANFSFVEFNDYFGAEEPILDDLQTHGGDYLSDEQVRMRKQLYESLKKKGKLDADDYASVNSKKIDMTNHKVNIKKRW